MLKRSTITAFLVLLAFFGMLAVQRLAALNRPASPLGPGDGFEMRCRQAPFEQWYRCEGSFQER